MKDEYVAPLADDTMEEGPVVGDLIAATLLGLGVLARELFYGSARLVGAVMRAWDEARRG